MRVVETRDRDRLREFFARDPIGAIYMLGDLEDRAFDRCRWWVAEDRAVLLLYTGLSVPVVLPFGAIDGLRELVRQVALPPRFYTKLDDEQRPLFRQWRLDSPGELYVMGLDLLVPSEPVAGLTCGLISNAADIAPLYDDYPGNYFDPAQVPVGLYAAAWLGGNMVAAGGTHAYAVREGAAALGNVVTATRWRGRRIARGLMHFLCDELLRRGVSHIGLHVERSNAAAIACYRHVGFSVHSEITQYTAIKE